MVFAEGDKSMEGVQRGGTVATKKTAIARITVRVSHKARRVKGHVEHSKTLTRIF